MASKKFDYIVVGGGTAGLTVANRLTEEPNVSVLVIEAGGDHTKDPATLTPGLMGMQYGNPEYDWTFSSVPQKELHGRKIAQPRGKQLGGSSALNFLMMVYPSRKSLDTWAEMGNEGWHYDAIAPYLAKATTVHPPSQTSRDLADLAYHDGQVVGNGPVQVSFGEGYSTTQRAWIKALEKDGLVMNGDPRSGSAMGAFQQPAVIDPATKTRSSAGTAHYPNEVAGRRNLTVITETVVKRIIFDTTYPEPVATGVIALSKDQEETSYTAGEVILAAGALMSPQILELSGIGGNNLLRSLDIPVILDNPHVGEHLQDHPCAAIGFEVNASIQTTDVFRDPAVMQEAIDQYQSDGRGPLGQSNNAMAYAPLCNREGRMTSEQKTAFFAEHKKHIKTEDDHISRRLLEDDKEPALQYMQFLGQGDLTVMEPKSMLDYLAPKRPENFISTLVFVNHPLSRGNVHIASADVHQLPTWDPKFNSNPLDLEILARSLLHLNKISKTAPFSELLKPDGARLPHDMPCETLEEAKEIARWTTVSNYHLAGSCTMRPRDKGGVVDNRLRVYGVKGLRVVDASIFPMVPTGNIQSLVYAVAEKAADIIKEDRKKA